MNSFNVDQICKYVKSIADNIQCVSCGHLKGLRVRYPCGHSVCENCVSTDQNCELCLSPQDVSRHVNDGPLSLRVKHASNLLNTFQELYELNVYRRLRVSQQLQLEKQLFPECIQAPSKYSNSRRISSISLINNKENIKPTVLPGENTSKSNITEMENKMSYVQHWLNKNDNSLSEANYNLPRKPFTDLNVNGQKVTRPKTPNKDMKKVVKIKKKLKDRPKLSLTRKRKDVETNVCKEIVYCKMNENECEKNKSCSVIENEIVVVNDTPSLDKDTNAWLAVIEADKNSTCDDMTVAKSSNLDNPIQCKKTSKVPFYKKSSLLKRKHVINQFNETTNIKNKVVQSTSNTNNVTITIDNSSFVTTIKFCDDQENYNKRTRFSIGVQTEDGNKSDNLSNNAELKLPENQNFKENQQIPNLGMCKNIVIESGHLYNEIAMMKANQKYTQQQVKEPKCLIIADSDSDTEFLPTGKDSLLEVTAEVHRSESEIDHSVLSQLEQGEYEHRMRHAGRGHTPASTDSSDKENYDPNRAKRQKRDKKCYNKKN